MNNIDCHPMTNKLSTTHWRSCEPKSQKKKKMLVTKCKWLMTKFMQPTVGY